MLQTIGELEEFEFMPSTTWGLVSAQEFQISPTGHSGWASVFSNTEVKIRTKSFIFKLTWLTLSCQIVWNSTKYGNFSIGGYKNGSYTKGQFIDPWALMSRNLNTAHFRFFYCSVDLHSYLIVNCWCQLLFFCASTHDGLSASVLYMSVSQSVQIPISPCMHSSSERNKILQLYEYMFLDALCGSDSVWLKTGNSYPNRDTEKLLGLKVTMSSL